ncbi:pantetheine-phosphate adenylyltransferase [Mycoplasma corogypsi]|uniref:pantetheine-phosphate adenylyltransferase n=1 Tax=Mycoplasma corogypsi TaxID=2106 RepID=UPI003872EF36
MKNKKIALFPGSFNPIHDGHLSIIKKAAKLFDFLYVAVTINPDKEKADIAKNTEIAIQEVKKLNLDNILVISNPNKFTADLARELNATYLVRSARNNIDYEYELEMAEANFQLNNQLQTILIFPDFDKIEYNSTILRHKEKMNV